MTTKVLVATGYDQVAEAYFARFGRSAVRAKKLGELIGRLPPGAAVLDLGCGCGLPAARSLVELGFSVTGVDLSSRQIQLARQSEPRAKFILADMIRVRFAAESFDAVLAFYSISHVPRAEHAQLIRRIALWLKPGGLFIACFGTKDGEWIEEWLGAAMLFSHHNPDGTKALVLAAGLRIETIETLPQDNESAEFLWICAQKSDGF